jgi:hypothetical protein
MKFALVNGQRQEALPTLSGTCPACGHPMLARCGEVRVSHWAHRGSRSCDPWWENETEWHRSWKAKFPDTWQEVVHKAESGERHIADVKTDHGWVIELQHSPIEPEERRSRDAYYQKLVWVVDGVRRKRDRKQLLRAWEESVGVGPMGRESPIRKAFFPEECALLREWGSSDAPIFFDLGDEQELWWLLKSVAGSAYVTRFSRTDFIELHRDGSARDLFDERVKDLSKSIADDVARLQAQAFEQVPRQHFDILQEYLVRKRRFRGRF